MSDEPTATHALPTPPALRLHIRVGRGVRRPRNWYQLARFALVGASGYAVNLVVFALCVHSLGINYRLAAAVAFLVAVSNNFAWNRQWTFKAKDGHVGFQAVRFFVVSLLAFAFNLLVLDLLISTAGMAEVPAQAIAIAAATPLNFVGNKLWSFRA
ncbi:MAG: GtrA family protein [Solirubrobacterales bacterium]|nr:GtrA family protein [Solirubrobacterales bacterium]